MNTHELEQSSLQAQAEAAERQGSPPGGDARLDRYRLVIRAVRAAPMPELPADFAARVAASAMRAEDSSRLEDALMSLLMGALAVTALFYVWPTLGVVLGHLQLVLPDVSMLTDVPWPLLIAAAVGVGLVWLLDRGASGWRQTHR